MKKSVSHDGARAALLALNFFLIIVVYSIVKPVRGALVADKLGTESLPYIWMVTAATIGLFVAAYGKLIDRFSRQWVLTFTTVFFGLTLLGIRYFLEHGGLRMIGLLSGVLYIWGDIFSVVMVEQFWSFTNDLFTTEKAKRWYGLIGSGAVAGGIAGSAVTAFLVRSVGTLNLIYVCEALLAVLVLGIQLVQRLSPPGAASEDARPKPDPWAGFRLVAADRYLTLLLMLVLLTQVMSNVIDYQFSALVQHTFAGVDAKTAFLGVQTIWVSVGSLAMSLIFYAPIHRKVGLLGALMFLPLTNLIGASLLLIAPLPTLLIALKTVDKALNYSIYRLSKEMLYIPTSREVKYKVKAVIDMFAYRFSKLIGSALILPWVAWFGARSLNWLTVAIIACLLSVIGLLYRQYCRLEGAERASAAAPLGEETSVELAPA